MTKLGGNFSKLWLATGISNLGDGMTLVAGPLLASQLTRDPLLVGGVVVALRLPWPLFALVSGAIADRADRRQLMVAANTFRAVVLAAFTAAVATETATIGALYVAMFLHGAAETLYDSSTQAVIPNVVQRDQLETANGRIVGTKLLADQISGHALGGVMFALAAVLPFGFDAFSFAASAALIASMSGKFTADRGRAPGTVRADIVEGLRWLWRHRALRTLALLGGVMNMIFTGLFAIFVLFAQERLGIEASGYGILLAVGAIGGFVGSVSASRLVGFGRAPVLVGAIAVQSLVWGVVAATRSPVIAGVVLGVGWFAIVAGGVVTASLRQSLVPDELMGRVSSAWRMLSWGLMPLGPIVVGAVAEWWGIAAPYGAAALVLLVLAALVKPVLFGGLEAHERPEPAAHQ